MTEQELQGRLQQIVSKNLTCTRHGIKTPDFQVQQFQEIKEGLALIYRENPDLNRNLEDGILVVAEQGLTRSQIDNIGVAAQLCIEYLNANLGHWNNESDPLKEIMICFLNLASIQSRKALKKFDDEEVAKHDQRLISSLVVTFNRFIKESESELEMQQKEFKEQMDAAKRQIASVSQDANTAQENAEKASKLARDAATSAKEAGEKLLKATGLLSTIEEKANSVESKATEAKNAAGEAVTTANGIIPNMLTVLGIFVGIIIAVVACYLSVLLSDKNGAISNKPLPVEFLRYWIMGHIMLMAIFLLLYLISKMTSCCVATRCGKFELAQLSNPKESGSETKQPECYKCVHRCSAPVRFRLRYSYMFVINVLFLFGYVILGVWQMINVYYRREFDRMMESITLPGALAIVSVILIAVIAIACCWLRVRKNGVKKTP